MDETMNPNPTILVADDSRSVRVVVKQKLTQSGFHVILAEDGQDAVDQIVACKPDAAVLDINMPVLDGYGVCGRLEELGIELPIVFLTGNGSNAVTLLGESFGAHLTKPVCGETLVQTIRDVIAIRN